MSSFGMIACSIFGTVHSWQRASSHFCKQSASLFFFLPSCLLFRFSSFFEAPRLRFEMIHKTFEAVQMRRTLSDLKKRNGYLVANIGVNVAEMGILLTNKYKSRYAHYA